MVIEERIVTTASAKTVHSIYAQVDRWHTWDPDTKSASIDGAFVTGATGTLAPQKGRAVKIRFTDVRPDAGFTCVGGIPGFTMTFDHELSDVKVGTLIVHRTTFSGFLAPIFARLMGDPLRAGLPKTLASLKRLAESNA